MRLASGESGGRAYGLRLETPRLVLRPIRLDDVDHARSRGRDAVANHRMRR